MAGGIMPGDVSLDSVAMDDVVRLRIDTAQVVREFLDLLEEQARAGETRAPAKPANRALFRELAPFRLVEFSYVDEGLGPVDGVYLRFADGSIYGVGDEIPEEVVDAAVSGDVAALAPVYIHLLLAQPQPPEVLERFMKALVTHLGKGLVAVYRGCDGVMAGHAFAHPDDRNPAALDAAVVKSVLEANMHLPKQRVLERYAARSQGADGRAWAQITYNFSKHVVEFASAADRDDFLDWSRTLCNWIYARWCRWEDLGFSEILRPAEPAPAPVGEIVAVRLSPPAKALEGRPWQAFGGHCASDAKSFDEFQAVHGSGALDQSLTLAREYWGYCIRTIDAAEAQARQMAETQANRPLKG